MRDIVGNAPAVVVELVAKALTEVLGFDGTDDWPDLSDGTKELFLLLANAAICEMQANCLVCF